MIINLIIIITASLIYYTYHVKEDVVDSGKEALIRRLRIKAGESGHLANDLLLKQKWHFYNWVKVAIFGVLTAYLYGGISLLSLYVIVIIATLRIVYFNPSVSMELYGSYTWKYFFHIGQGKWEKLFEGKEVLYYLTNLAILIICYCLIIFRVY